MFSSGMHSHCSMEHVAISSYSLDVYVCMVWCVYGVVCVVCVLWCGMCMVWCAYGVMCVQ